MTKFLVVRNSLARIGSLLDKHNRRIGGAALACLIAGVALSGRIEPGVHVQTVTIAGHVPALQFLPAGPGPHPVALLAHGYSSSKEFFFCYGEALAAAGFDCFAVDQAGHGASPRLFSVVEATHTLAAAAQAVGPVDVFIGHSMGGFTGAEALRQGGMKPKLFIALGSAPVLGQHGPPLLLLAGRFDQVFPPALLRARTDARLVLSPWSEHGLELYDPLLINAAVEAACAAVGKTPPAPATCWCWRLAGIVLALLGATGLALCLPTFSPRWAWGRGLVVATVFIITFVLTTRLWLYAMPQPRLFPAQAAAIAVALLALLGLGRLRVPRWGCAVIAAMLWLCVVAVPGIQSVVLARAPSVTMTLTVNFLPAVLVGTILGQIAARRGSRFDGDLTLAIILGCALFA